MHCTALRGEVRCQMSHSMDSWERLDGVKGLGRLVLDWMGRELLTISNASIVATFLYLAHSVSTRKHIYTLFIEIVKLYLITGNIYVF